MKKLSLFVRNIKKGFATNSSSYHSTLIMTDEEHTKWVNGEIEVDGESHDDWYESDYAEHDETSYITPGGEKIIVLCKHGSDY